MPTYTPSSDRYHKMPYARCGKSGLLLPRISLGLWHNFGFVDDFDNVKRLLFHAFDQGITHFDLANNYGPPYGTAEINFGKVMEADFRPFRDEMIISTKAGYDMWEGPYGNWGSKKYLIASLDQSLKRMGLEYVDIFYHHRPDPETPLEETMHALDLILKQGKALYVGVSNYKPKETQKAADILKSLGTPFVIHQPRYNMLDRWVENGLLDTLEQNGIGSIVFSPLAQGMLSDKYLNGIPENSRAAKDHGHLRKEWITEDKIEKIQKLNAIAKKRDQSLAQMSIAWLLKDKRVTSVLTGARTVEQLQQSIDSIHNLSFSETELSEIEAILS